MSVGAVVNRSVPRPTFGYKPQLDGLRAFAVSLVIVGHGSRGRIHGAAAGVEVFFALSGFLITSLLLEEHGRTGRINLRAFYVRRARRLLPALGLAILLALALFDVSSPASRHHLGWAILGAIFYANNWLISEGVIHTTSILGHTWSLAEEEQFYFVWPTILWLALRRWSVSTIFRVTLGATIFLAFLRPIMFALEGGSDRVAYGSDTRAFGLMLGACAALAYATDGQRAFVERIASRAGLALLAFAGILLVWYRISADTRTGIVFGDTAVDIAAALIVAHLVSRPQSINGRSLSWRPVVWIGQRSYGMYLFHIPILLALLHEGPHLSWLELTFVAGALTVGCAAASYRFVEQPARGRGRRVPVTAPVDPVASVPQTAAASLD